MARVVMDQVSAQLGQPVIVENRPGAGNTIGMAAVAKAEPDGYTVLANSSTHTVTPATRSNLGFEMTDLAADRPARQHACGDGVQSIQGLQEAQRLRRLREGQSRLGQLRVGGRRQFIASQRRAVSPRCRLRCGASAVQGRAGSDDRGHRRARRLLLRAAGECAAAAEGRPAAGAGRERLVARLGAARRAHHGRGRDIRTRNTISGPACSLPAKTPADIRAKLSAEMPRRCSIRRSARSSTTSAPTRCRSPRRNSRRW